MKVTGIVTAAALACAGGAASASTVMLAGGGALLSVGPGSPVGQDFVLQLEDAGALTLYSGAAGTPLTLELMGDATVTFSLVGAESSFDNELSLGGSPIITETFAFSALGDFTTGALGGQSFSTVLTSGTDIASLLTYAVGGTTFGSGDDEFGVFADASMIGALTTFYLGLDDSGNSSDDDHDDMIVRVDIEAASVVPLPAAAWMLIAGLGGLFGLRKFRKTA